jgi:hypothetical protein
MKITAAFAFLLAVPAANAFVPKSSNSAKDTTMKITAAFAFLLAVPAANAFVTKSSNSAKDTALFAEAPRAPRLPPKYLDNKGLAHIFEKNRDWVNAKKAQDKKFFDKLGKTHTPEYMYIGM